MPEVFLVTRDYHEVIKKEYENLNLKLKIIFEEKCTFNIKVRENEMNETLSSITVSLMSLGLLHLREIGFGG